MGFRSPGGDRRGRSWWPAANQREQEEEGGVQGLGLVRTVDGSACPCRRAENWETGLMWKVNPVQASSSVDSRETEFRKHSTLKF